MLLLAFLAQYYILCGKPLEELLLLLFLLVLLSDHLLEMFVLGFQILHLALTLAQFSADETLRQRLLDVVAAVDGEEEIIQRSLHVATVERLHRIVILTVRLALREGGVDGVLVVVVAGELLHLVPHEHLALTNGLLQADALQTGASRQGNVSLTTGEHAAREVDLHLVEGQALALVYRYRPSQSQRILLVASDFLLLDFLLHLVEVVAHVAPGGRLHHHVQSLLRAHVNFGVVLFVETDDGAQRAVHPLVLDVVLDEDDLCPSLQIELNRRGQTALWELALNVATEKHRLAWQQLELAVVDIVYRVAASAEGDGEFRVALVKLGSHSLVETLQVLHRHLRGADMVQDVDEHGVALSVHLPQFDAHQLELLEYLGIEEETAAIEGRQHPSVVLSYHGLQLVDVAYKQKLFAPERLPHVAAVHAQHLVDEVDDVGAHHTDLVDDDEFHLTDNLNFFGVIFQRVADVAHAVHAVVGK